MITEKVLGAYAAIGTLPPIDQAVWYRRAAGEWGIKAFEIPILAGQTLPDELVETFADLGVSLVVTMVTQWAGRGQAHPTYGLAAPEAMDRYSALLDLYSAMQHCTELEGKGVRIRNLAVHTGCRSAETIAHAIAFHQSLIELQQRVTEVLKHTVLCVELTDHRPLDYAVPFPAAKKAALTSDEVVQTIAAVNRQISSGSPIQIEINWGRLLVNGDEPLPQIERLLGEAVPLAGVILSGAGASPDGYLDSHNSHLDPNSGFSAADGVACARLLADSAQTCFIGMKCSVKAPDALSAEMVLKAQVELLDQMS